MPTMAEVDSVVKSGTTRLLAEYAEMCHASREERVSNSRNVT